MTAQIESDTLVDPDRVVIRPLRAADSAAYRRLRQHILDIGEGGFFSSSYTTEQQFTSEDQWREWCTETPIRCTIGILVDGDLVGVMGIVPCGDPEHRTAEWNATWIDPRFRKSGLASQARERVREWSRVHGYRYAIVDIRADNARNLGIRAKEGAVYLCTRRGVTWADGSTADTHFFILSLSPGTETSRSPAQAVELLEAARAFLRHEHGV